MNYRKVAATLIVIGLGLVSPPARAQGLELAAVPEDWPAEVRAELTAQREQIQAHWTRFLADKAAFASAYAGTLAGTPQGAAAAARKAELKHRADDIVDDADRFNEHVAQIARQRAFVPPRSLSLDPTFRRIIDALLALATKRGWSAEKLARAKTSLYALGYEDMPPPVEDVQHAWADILQRRQDPALAAAATGGEGPAWASSGVQTKSEDCAVFALANATGRPYGYVAAVATKLLADGTWRSDADRAHPQQAIERLGLNGGEVVMLAESLGQAEVIPSISFAKTLRGGRPIMIDVIPSAGQGAHEVVLTRTFSHEGETWFEMTESYQKPTVRLYLRAAELDIILKEKGVAYRPEPGTTPRLLQ